MKRGIHHALMPRKPAAGVRVRGTCPDGHVTNTVSPPGKVTWRGECMQTDCTHRVLCRRVTGAQSTAPPGAPATSSPPSADGKVPVKRVNFNAPKPKHARAGTGSSSESGTGAPAGAVEQQPVPEPAGVPASPPADGVPAASRGGRVARLIERRGARAHQPRASYSDEFPAI